MTQPPLPDGTPPPGDPYTPVDYPANYPHQPPPGYPTPYPPYPAPSAYPPPTGYPYPQPGYGGYPGYTADPYDPYRPIKPPGTNGKAIAALVTSLAGLLLCGLPSIAGIILGIIAMRETKRTGQDGFGLGVAGVAIGGVVVALYLLYFVFVVIVAAGTASSPDYYP
ncbi:integral membrane protein [Mycolicibacterium rhodesiae JS60]|nr:integral membrane protein [Mycolicibacterium rhodesiae JS60]